MSSSQIEVLKSEALKLFADESYNNLHDCLTKMVELNDSWGIHYLAGTYVYGHGVPLDQPKANELF